VGHNEGIDTTHLKLVKRLTFANGERSLSEWMEENAFVVWMLSSEPWVIEHGLFDRLDLPLNLDRISTIVFIRS
jgi:hypothetical protein